MFTRKIFVTGIDTNIGKTIVSAVLVQALGADYWKPIQSGDLKKSDSMKIEKLVTNPRTRIHLEKYRLTQPLSPHESARIDGKNIKVEDFEVPISFNNNIIIEGAGGLMVPINHDGDYILDVIKQLDCEVLIVSKNYLGSINHTLMTVEMLKKYDIPILGFMFNGASNKASEEIILKNSRLPLIAKLPEGQKVDSAFIHKCAKDISSELYFHFQATR